MSRARYKAHDLLNNLPEDILLDVLHYYPSVGWSAYEASRSDILIDTKVKRITIPSSLPIPQKNWCLAGGLAVVLLKSLKGIYTLFPKDIFLQRDLKEFSAELLAPLRWLEPAVHYSRKTEEELCRLFNINRAILLIQLEQLSVLGGGWFVADLNPMDKE